MGVRRSLFGSVVAAGVALLPCWTTPWAQTPSAPAGSRTADTGKSQAPQVVHMTECEGVNNCASWTFLGTQGNGQWPSGDIGNLNVERFDRDSIVIRRADSTGNSAGLTAVYNGTRHGDRVGGEFTSNWPGHWDNKTGNWYATIGSVSGSAPPAMLRFCGVHCITYRLDGERYVSTIQNPGHPTWHSVMDIGSFTPESIVLNRVDYDNNKAVFKVTMTGKFAPDGNSITDTAMNGTHNPWRLVWGSDINSIPGEDPIVVPTVVVAPVLCVPWFFTVICG
jgi:hypothetical protein